MVLMGIAALERDWMQVCRHLAPLVAFFFGVGGSMFLRERRAFITGLTLEIVALMIAAMLPEHFPSILFSAFVALFGSLQSATFRQVDRFSYNSTFVTGNLRTAAEGKPTRCSSADRLRARRTRWRRGRLQAHELGLICLAFFAGGGAGSVAGAAIWQPEPVGGGRPAGRRAGAGAAGGADAAGVGSGGLILVLAGRPSR